MWNRSYENENIWKYHELNCRIIIIINHGTLGLNTGLRLEGNEQIRKNVCACVYSTYIWMTVWLHISNSSKLNICFRFIFRIVHTILWYVRSMIDEWQQTNKRSRNPSEYTWGIILRFTFQVYISYLEHNFFSVVDCKLSGIIFFFFWFYYWICPFFTMNRLLLQYSKRLVCFHVSLLSSLSLFSFSMMVKMVF